MPFQVNRFGWENPTTPTSNEHSSRVFPFGAEGFSAGSTVGSGGSRTRIVDMFSFSKLEPSQMKAGGMGPTAYQKCRFPLKRFCTQQGNILVWINACAGITHNSQLTTLA
jgi:hypothetical protein